ncbi:MAG: hypothetical protein EOO36_17725, partial [Cytophagaceae bacterium]
MHTPLLPLFLAFATLGTAAAQAPAAPLAAPAPGPTQLSGAVLDGAGRPLPGVNVFLKTTFD